MLMYVVHTHLRSYFVLDEGIGQPGYKKSVPGLSRRREARKQLE